MGGPSTGDIQMIRHQISSAEANFYSTRRTVDDLSSTVAELKQQMADIVAASKRQRSIMERLAVRAGVTVAAIEAELDAEEAARAAEEARKKAEEDAAAAAKTAAEAAAAAEEARKRAEEEAAAQAAAGPAPAVAAEEEVAPLSEYERRYLWTADALESDQGASGTAAAAAYATAVPVDDPSTAAAGSAAVATEGTPAAAAPSSAASAYGFFEAAMTAATGGAAAGGGSGAASGYGYMADYLAPASPAAPGSAGGGAGGGLSAGAASSAYGSMEGGLAGDDDDAVGAALAARPPPPSAVGGYGAWQDDAPDLSAAAPAPAPASASALGSASAVQAPSAAANAYGSMGAEDDAAGLLASASASGYGSLGSAAASAYGSIGDGEAGGLADAGAAALAAPAPSALAAAAPVPTAAIPPAAPAAAVAPPPPLAPGERDWNDEWAAAQDMPVDTPPQRLARALRLHAISREFESSCEATVRGIVDDLLRPASQRVFRSVDVGGVAGGLKFVAHNIFFKFARDVHGLFGGDEFAMKAAALETGNLRTIMKATEAAAALDALRAAAATAAPADAAAPRLASHWVASTAPGMDAGRTALRTPLAAVLDYAGFRVLALGRLPIGKDSLVYGSADAAQTVKDEDAVMRAGMKRLAQRLNLKEHRVSPSQTLHLCVDIEGHVGGDGRRWIVDTARVFPPEAPSASLTAFLLHAQRKKDAAAAAASSAASSDKKGPSAGVPAARILPVGSQSTTHLDISRSNPVPELAAVLGVHAPDDGSSTAGAPGAAAAAAALGRLIRRVPISGANLYCRADANPHLTDAGVRPVTRTEHAAMSTRFGINHAASAVLDQFGVGHGLLKGAQLPLYGDVALVVGERGQHLYTALRGEQLSLQLVPLSSDAFSYFGRWDGASHNVEVKAVTTEMMQRVLPLLAARLRQRSLHPIYPHNEAALVAAMHEAGVNVRFAGVLRVLISGRFASGSQDERRMPSSIRRMRALLMTTMVTRVLKQLLRNVLRSVPAISANLPQKKGEAIAAAPVGGAGGAVVGAAKSEADAEDPRLMVLRWCLNTCFAPVGAWSAAQQDSDEGEAGGALWSGLRGAAALLAQQHMIDGDALWRVVLRPFLQLKFSTQAPALSPTEQASTFDLRTGLDRAVVLTALCDQLGIRLRPQWLEQLSRDGTSSARSASKAAPEDLLLQAYSQGVPLPPAVACNLSTPLPLGCRHPHDPVLLPRPMREVSGPHPDVVAAAALLRESDPGSAPISSSGSERQAAPGDLGLYASPFWYRERRNDVSSADGPSTGDVADMEATCLCTQKLAIRSFWPAADPLAVVSDLQAGLAAIGVDDTAAKAASPLHGLAAVRAAHVLARYAGTHYGFVQSTSSEPATRQRTCSSCQYWVDAVAAYSNTANASVDQSLAAFRAAGIKQHHPNLAQADAEKEATAAAEAAAAVVDGKPTGASADEALFAKDGSPSPARDTSTSASTAVTAVSSAAASADDAAAVSAPSGEFLAAGDIEELGVVATGCLSDSATSTTIALHPAVMGPTTMVARALNASLGLLPGFDPLLCSGDVALRSAAGGPEGLLLSWPNGAPVPSAESTAAIAAAVPATATLAPVAAGEGAALLSTLDRAMEPLLAAELLPMDSVRLVPEAGHIAYAVSNIALNGRAASAAATSAAGAGAGGAAAAPGAAAARRSVCVEFVLEGGRSYGGLHVGFTAVPMTFAFDAATAGVGDSWWVLDVGELALHCAGVKRPAAPSFSQGAAAAAAAASTLSAAAEARRGSSGVAAREASLSKSASRGNMAALPGAAPPLIRRTSSMSGSTGSASISSAAATSAGAASASSSGSGSAASSAPCGIWEEDPCVPNVVSIEVDILSGSAAVRVNGVVLPARMDGIPMGSSGGGSSGGGSGAGSSGVGSTGAVGAAGTDIRAAVCLKGGSAGSDCVVGVRLAGAGAAFTLVDCEGRATAARNTLVGAPGNDGSAPPAPARRLPLNQLAHLMATAEQGAVARPAPVPKPLLALAEAALSQAVMSAAGTDASCGWSAVLGAQASWHLHRQALGPLNRLSLEAAVDLAEAAVATGHVDLAVATLEAAAGVQLAAPAPNQNARLRLPLHLVVRAYSAMGDACLVHPSAAAYGSAAAGLSAQGGNLGNETDDFHARWAAAEVWYARAVEAALSASPNPAMRGAAGSLLRAACMSGRADQESLPFRRFMVELQAARAKRGQDNTGGGPWLEAVPPVALRCLDRLIGAVRAQGRQTHADGLALLFLQLWREHPCPSHFRDWAEQHAAWDHGAEGLHIEPASMSTGVHVSEAEIRRGRQSGGRHGASSSDADASGSSIGHAIPRRGQAAFSPVVAVFGHAAPFAASVHAENLGDWSGSMLNRNVSAPA